MERNKSLNSGYALVLLVIIVSIMLTISSVMLTIAVMNYKMKTINSQEEKAFYLAEAGAEEAYVISKEYVRSAIEYANNEVLEFKENAEQDIYEELNEIFCSSFEDYIIGNNLNSMTNKGLINILNDNSSYLINEDGYPVVIAEIEEKNDHFLIEIRSVYIHEQIEKNTVFKLKINIPCYDDDYNINSILEIINWEVEG